MKTTRIVTRSGFTLCKWNFYVTLGYSQLFRIFRNILIFSVNWWQSEDRERLPVMWRRMDLTHFTLNRHTGVTQTLLNTRPSNKREWSIMESRPVDIFDTTPLKQNNLNIKNCNIKTFFNQEKPSDSPRMWGPGKALSSSLTGLGWDAGTGVQGKAGPCHKRDTCHTCHNMSHVCCQEVVTRWWSDRVDMELNKVLEAFWHAMLFTLIRITEVKIKKQEK